MPASLLQNNRFKLAFSLWWGAWTFLHFLVLYNAGISGQVAFYDSIISNLLLAGAAILISLTLQYYLPGQNKYSYLLGLCFVLCLIWASLSRALIMLLIKDDRPEYSSFLSQSLFIRIATGFLILSCAALISVLWYTLQDQKETERRRTEADQLSKEAELNNLRQQLQPHFLFNSLNSINALVVMHPQKARNMIQQLSDFLRGTLKKEQKSWITLQEELQHLELYLEIEKVRFGHRLSTQITGQATEARLPVMLLQPVVENAIKFGLYNTTGNITITVEAIMENGMLSITVTNPFDTETSAPKGGTGFGLSSVQRRLFLLFARQDLLQTKIQDDHFITTIKIPQP